eukprot:TRINITY_DN10759_c0_g1_i1.p1 TRINITY_DN10759_c0_g1~~TRINITY_DN10759_c0_g1_i1.p1  ORF type:complete len:285 (-),score=69.65 TRINITY_DN10759_c0_g1_i1:340-1194(-)
MSYCIPEGCQVLVERYSDTIPVCELQAADRLLCINSLTNQLQYVSVDSVEVKEPDHQTLRVVTLEDGSSMTATADHPFFARSASASCSSFVRAQDLISGEHRIKFNRLDELSVHSSEVTCESTPRPVSMPLQHGQHHHISGKDNILATDFDQGTPLTRGTASLKPKNLVVNNMGGELQYRESEAEPSLSVQDSKVHIQHTTGVHVEKQQLLFGIGQLHSANAAVHAFQRPGSRNMSTEVFVLKHQQQQQQKQQQQKQLQMQKQQQQQRDGPGNWSSSWDSMLFV